MQNGCLFSKLDHRITSYYTGGGPSFQQAKFSEEKERKKKMWPKKVFKNPYFNMGDVRLFLTNSGL